VATRITEFGTDFGEDRGESDGCSYKPLTPASFWPTAPEAGIRAPQKIPKIAARQRK